MKEQYTFKALKFQGLEDALKLIRDVFYEVIAPEFSEEGIQEFMDFIEIETFKDMLIKDEIHLWVCYDGGKVVGALAGSSNYINLLFVSGQYHRKGIARRLLDMMIEQFHSSEIIVKSSLYAVEAYRKLGFYETDCEQIEKGIRFIPMKRILTKT